MDPKEIGCEEIEWNHMAQWWAVINTVMYSGFYTRGNFLTRLATVRLSTRALLHGVISYIVLKGRIFLIGKDLDRRVGRKVLKKTMEFSG
jgi:hypothetical protein